ncbi:MAG: helix-turn-helix transcriptional regulator, partial [Porticoccaceae bacterium]|nr:helix-turn-helix transcriptional regulator [Porticoccaceae bacterium]
LRIHDLVARLGVSNRALERRFRKYLNTTPNTYYREMRLTHANNLLLNTTMSIAEIGLACGFASGFSSLYKSLFDVSPAAFRKARRKGAYMADSAGALAMPAAPIPKPGKVE